MQHASTIDLTCIFDPEVRWPNPLSCPDWSVGGLGARGETIYPTREVALSRLAALGARLNATGELRRPTDAEAEAVRAELFQPLSQAHTSWGDWGARDFKGFAPRNHVVEQKARDIVEALHLRGFLRKLDAQAVRSQQAAADQARARKQAIIDRHEANAPVLRAELERLAEAEARHKQREADEAAFTRATELRRALQEGAAAANSARRDLERADAA